MNLHLSESETRNLATAMRKLLPSLLSQIEKECCESVYAKLIKLIEAKDRKRAKRFGLKDE